MAKSKTMYHLKGVFTNLLRDTEKDNFLIPTYQRGYKWTSGDEKSQVDILLSDLLNAYQVKNGRYYLQFLTLKDKDNELEVIDGQQRLTTLSIFFCVLCHHLNESETNNFVSNRLKYQTRQNFIEKFIYNNIDTLLKNDDWEEFIEKNPDHDNQDVYFIFNAVNTINHFVINKVDDPRDFLEYVAAEVYLIINLLDENLNSEKVFVNVNKGVKLNDEDLVKGLLITKLPLDLRNQKNRATEVEINEIRTNLGRQWDDLVNWTHREDVRTFFKSESGKSRLDWLIKLTYPDIRDDASGHPMFSYFDKLYSKKGGGAQDIFQSLRSTKMMLNDWFGEPEIGNLLGFILAANNGPRKEVLWQELSQMPTKASLLALLKSTCLDLLPLDDHYKLIDLNYEEHPRQLFNVFLLLDIMKFLPIRDRVAKAYDFTKIVQENWSLEHIFPQNAKDFNSLDTLSTSDLKIIRELLDDNIENLNEDPSEEGRELLAFYEKITQSATEVAIDKDDRARLVLLLKTNAPQLHDIGNLALLLRNMNSGLSNHYFNKKREKLVRKISDGQFVPYHTYDVFSKLIIKHESGLHTWSKKDIREHSTYIKGQVTEITNYLTQQ